MKLLPKEFIETFKACPGAFSVCEAIALYNIVQDVPQGIYVELGSHRGKSGMAAAAGLKPGTFYLVDLIFDDEKTALEVASKVYKMGNGVETEPVCMYSTDFIPTKDNYAYCFVDTGSHSYELVVSELNLLKDRMALGGIIAFHDCSEKSQFTGVKKAYDELAATSEYEPIEINWDEIFDCVVSNKLEEGNNSWHLYPELPHPPNFVAALKRVK